jgi:hypothetical protein
LPPWIITITSSSAAAAVVVVAAAAGTVTAGSIDIENTGSPPLMLLRTMTFHFNSDKY